MGDDESGTVSARSRCEHVLLLEPGPAGYFGPAPTADGCEDCLRIGGTWLHLRRCLECGHIGCCDGSPNRHARAHFHETSHPMVQSFEPGEDWVHCFADEATMRSPIDAPSPSHR
jgi:uncharacterized UBP type Zn finger protein